VNPNSGASVPHLGAVPMPGRVLPGQLGLCLDQVRQRLLAGQVNLPPPSVGRTLGQIVRVNVMTRFNAILGALLVVVAIVGPVQDGLFGVVLVANTAIGIAQEVRAKRTLDHLAILTAPRAHVLRRAGPDDEAIESDIPVEEIVIDDLLLLRPGDQVPVDAVTVDGVGLELDEALLSGESEPASKGPGDNLLSGSFVVAGTGTAVATGVGEGAYALRLEAQARRFSLIHSELQSGTNSILRMITWVMVPTGVALTTSQLLRSHQSLSDALRSSVAGVAAMVPEGLVLLTSIAFAAGAIRLARRRVLVQELAALEGLARVDVLCIDKTGTLTEPGMRLEGVEVAAGQTEAAVREVVGALVGADSAPNATMQALESSCRPPDNWVVTDQVPFSSDRKWSAATFADHGTWVLGAPELLTNELPALLEETRVTSEAAGRRVVLLARGEGPIVSGELPTLVPIALLVLAEQLRNDAVRTIGYLLDQKVTIKVLSGDAPETVAAVAEKVGLPVLGPPCDASTLEVDETSLGRALDTTNVFGRVRPDQKVAVVRTLQARGHVVAMIGDGVNDVQALKQAELGIAMGSGSQSSRAVARIVLLDGSFAAVPQILVEGRRVIANIERVANLFVTKTVYAAVLAIVVAIGGIPYPFFPRHLTIVSTFTIGVPGFVLAFAAGAPRAESGFLRKVLVFTVPVGTIMAGAILVVYAVARATPHATVAQARCAALLALFVIALWVLGLIARPVHPDRVALIIAMAGGLGVLLAIPLARRVFSLQVPPMSVVLIGAVVAVVAVGLMTLSGHWLERLMSNKLQGGAPDASISSAVQSHPEGTSRA